MKRSTKYYADRRKDAERLRDAGATYKDIAEVFGMSISRVHAMLRDITEGDDHPQHWPAPTLKQMSEAERNRYRPNWVAIARACEEGWARKAAGLPDPAVKTRAAGAE